MLFHSSDFLIFFVALLVLLFFYRQNRAQKVLYLIASYIFYMWWNPAFIILIIFTTAANFVLGKLIWGDGSRAKRRIWLALSLCANLGILGFFKYYNFFEQNLFVFLQCVGYEANWVSRNIVLPVGISFYTFQAMSYTIDVYRDKMRPTNSVLDFAVFVSFFPQLVAGPIVRASQFLPQLKKQRRHNFDFNNLVLIYKGLFKKVVIADNLDFFVNAIFSNPEAAPSLIIWIAAVGFSVQIYCDFSGYTDIAIGIAGLLGFAFPTNFKKPYFAKTPSEFWRKWHITLSTWLRDYIYISMGGNRRGTYVLYRNLMLTMLLGGLWHGASWNFVLWGGLHGLILIIYRIFDLDEHIQKANKLIQGVALLGMQLFVVMTWITFRITDFSKMFVALKKFVLFDFNFSIQNVGLGKLNFFSTLVIILMFYIFHTFTFISGELDRQAPKWGKSLYVSLIVATVVFYFFIPTKESPFIYFQF